MIPCVWKQLTGIDCLACGFQRSFVALIQGNIWESVRLFPALIPLLILALFTLIHLIHAIRNGNKIIVSLFICSTVLMVGNYGWKLYSGDLFH